MEQAQVTQQNQPPQLALTTLAQPLFNVESNDSLAQTLNWKSAKLLTMLGRKKSEHYSVLHLRKKGTSKNPNGKLRIIHNPDDIMRVVQFKILKRILEKFETPDYIYAFEKGRSIPNMAQTHVGKKIVLSFDLKDFFTSIKQYHLVQIFQALGFSQPPALTLSELCTYKSFVPQGALTSPKLSNIVTAMTFGPHVKAYCEAKGYDLTIYADDLTISTNQDLDGQEGRDTVKSLCESIKSFVTQYGFRVNGAKTKVMKTYQRQYVCGAVVNQKVNLQKTERHVLRAMVYNCNKNGIEAESKKTGLTPGEFAAKLLGRLNWYAQLNPVAGKEMLLEFYEKSYKDMPSSSPIVTGGGVEASGSSDFPSLPQETISEKDTPW